MNWAHVHLVLNHLPVLAVPFGLALTLAGVIRTSEDLRRAGLLTFAAAAILTLPVYFTGEPAERVIEGIPSISGPAIEEHEDAAGAALAAVWILGGLAAAGLVSSLRRGATPRWAVLAAAAAAVLAGGLLARAANLGGRVHHPEIRPEAATAGPGEEDGGVN